MSARLSANLSSLRLNCSNGRCALFDWIVIFPWHRGIDASGDAGAKLTSELQNSGQKKPRQMRGRSQGRKLHEGVSA